MEHSEIALITVSQPTDLTQAIDPLQLFWAGNQPPPSPLEGRQNANHLWLSWTFISLGTLGSLCVYCWSSLFLSPSLYFLLDLGRSTPDGAFHVHCLAEPRKSGDFYVNFNSTNAWLSIPHAVCSLLVWQKSRITHEGNTQAHLWGIT